jgi:hypothetical protein
MVRSSTIDWFLMIGTLFGIAPAVAVILYVVIPALIIAFIVWLFTVAGPFS